MNPLSLYLILALSRTIREPREKSDILFNICRNLSKTNALIIGQHHYEFNE
jgi:hypothetical protein